MHPNVGKLTRKRISCVNSFRQACWALAPEACILLKKLQDKSCSCNLTCQTAPDATHACVSSRTPARNTMQEARVLSWRGHIRLEAIACVVSSMFGTFRMAKTRVLRSISWHRGIRRKPQHIADSGARGFTGRRGRSTPHPS